ncbi:hypothetical protein D3C75_140540 [compost metagenome]
MGLKFINGRHVEFTGMAQPVGGVLHYEIKTVQDFNERQGLYYSTSMVPITDLQDICTDLFPLGTRIRSTLGDNIENALIGSVVGHELATNRVIVVSDKITSYKDQRTRYSYAITELVEYKPLQYDFQPGKKYIINSNEAVLAVDELFNPGFVSLVFINGSKEPIRNIPATGELKDYLKVGINFIKPLGGFVNA